MLFTNSIWLSPFIALYLILGPRVLAKSTGIIKYSCLVWKPLPSNHRIEKPLEKSLENKLKKFVRGNNECLSKFYGRSLGSCAIKQPNDILTAYWLSFDEYSSRLNDIQKSNVSPQELCQNAVNKIEAANKQYTRDLMYFIDNVKRRICLNVCGFCLEKIIIFFCCCYRLLKIDVPT